MSGHLYSILLMLTFPARDLKGCEERISLVLCPALFVGISLRKAVCEQTRVSNQKDPQGLVLSLTLGELCNLGGPQFSGRNHSSHWMLIILFVCLLLWNMFLMGRNILVKKSDFLLKHGEGTLLSTFGVGMVTAVLDCCRDRGQPLIRHWQVSRKSGAIRCIDGTKHGSLDEGFSPGR